MDNQRKWLDLSAAGFNLDHRLHVSGNFHIFVLTRIAGMKESSSIAQELVNAGFKAFPWGYSAKMTYGTASFLAQLPGAVRITLTQTEEASNDEHYPASDGRGSLTGDDSRKVRSGSIRVLIGSTAKMGEGTNVQERIVAIHDMDPPWRATDIEQRGGRAERFGNINTKIRRYIYTVQDTFDTFMWHVLKHKAELFFRVLKGDPGIRELTLEVDPTFAETAAITSNNQLVREKLEVEQGIAKLEMRARAHLDKVHGARRLAAIFRGRRDEIQKQLHVYASLAPAESSKVWRFDLSNYGHSSTFKGSRDGLVKLLRKIVETQGLRVIKGMSCAGQPVTLKILPDKKDWVIGPVGAQIHRENASSVEKFFQDYEATVAKLKRDEESTEVQIADALAEAESKCDVDEELITLRARHREILAEIELESQKTLEIEGESLDADPAGVDWSDDLDESPSQTA